MRKLLLLFIPLLFNSVILSQNSLTDLVTETQKTTPDSGDDIDNLYVVWWMLPEFWEKTFSEDPTISPEEGDLIVSMFRKYSIFAMVFGELGPMGIPNYKSEKFMQANTLLVHPNKRRYSPQKKDEIDGDTQMIIGFLEMYLSQILGDLGENITICVFDCKTINPLEDDDFQIIIDKESFTFELPLGSLLPLKFCPEDGEKFNGAWSYCPFHGTYLRKSK